MYGVQFFSHDLFGTIWGRLSEKMQLWNLLILLVKIYRAAAVLLLVPSSDADCILNFCLNLTSLGNTNTPSPKFSSLRVSDSKYRSPLWMWLPHHRCPCLHSCWFCAINVVTQSIVQNRSPNVYCVVFFVTRIWDGERTRFERQRPKDLQRPLSQWQRSSLTYTLNLKKMVRAWSH